MKKVLTIAGSDCSGGAGIQADLKTMTAHKVYGMSVITALTAQNTTGVFGIHDAGAEFVGQQLDCIFKDIYPDAIKIGMVSNIETIRIIAAKLKEYKARNIVVDPVMISTSGYALMSEDAMDTLIHELLPLGSLLTPNIPEAERLCRLTIESVEDMVAAAEKISQNLNGAVLVKGGHLTDTADDLLYVDSKQIWYKSDRIETKNTHGTGCTLSSAIACNLAMGYDMAVSVENAKAYITGALKDGLAIGQGNGPLNHCFGL